MDKSGYLAYVVATSEGELGNLQCVFHYVLVF